MSGAPARGALLISGFYGRFKNMDETRFNALKRDGEAGVTVAAPAEGRPPAGGGRQDQLRGAQPEAALPDNHLPGLRLGGWQHLGVGGRDDLRYRER